MAFFRRKGEEAGANGHALVDTVSVETALRPDGRRPETRLAELKIRIHRELIEQLDLSRIQMLSSEELQTQIRAILETMLADETTPLSRPDRERIVDEVWHETFGLGPLEPLMQDPTISDILVNGASRVYVERRGKLERCEAAFRDDTHLLQVIDRIVSRVGRRVDESSPMVDARLPDGSRVNAIIPPLALDGPVLSIRRFATEPYTMSDLVEFGTLSPMLGQLLEAAVRVRLNLVVAGGTGAGKTTLLNVLSHAIPGDERIVTIEDSAELQLQQQHVVRLETRPANIEGTGAVTQRDLLRNALRMRPDRILLGEVRGVEVLDMLQAMNTGHDGSLSTVHANSSRDAIGRLETMVLLSGVAPSVRAIREYIASALDVIVHVARMSDGTRKILRVTEVTGMEQEVVTTQDIFVFDQGGVAADGRVLGTHRPTGVRPRFADRVERAGVSLPPELFHPGRGERR